MSDGNKNDSTIVGLISMVARAARFALVDRRGWRWLLPPPPPPCDGVDLGHPDVTTAAGVKLE